MVAVRRRRAVPGHPEVEDVACGGGKPVAVPGGAGRDGDDRGVEVVAVRRRRAEERCVVRVDGAVGLREIEAALRVGRERVRDDGLGGLETRCVLVRRVVVEERGRRARRIQLPRRGTGDEPAGDPPGAADLLVALAVAEGDAPGLALRAARQATPTGQAVAGGSTEGGAVRAVPVAVAAGVAVDVVPGSGAEDRPVRAPPAAREGPGRAHVLAVEHAAELAVTVAAGRPAAARRVATLADGVVGTDRTEREDEGGHGEG